MVIVYWYQETGKLTKNTELNLSHFIGFYALIMTHHHILLDSTGKAGLCATSPRQNTVQDVVSIS